MANGMFRDVASAYDFSRRFAALDDINRGLRGKAERERKAAEATIELNEQTKIQNQLLREQNQRLNETIMQLKDQHGNKSLPSTANASYQFDVFVSHANDNKEEFVNALTAELSRLGISIWYDANILASSPQCENKKA